VKTVAIVQSSYIPWKGYFDLIDRCDELILLDDVQYTRHDWRNRNRIKTPAGVQWLTIPVRYDGNAPPRVFEAEIADRRWADRHARTLSQAYARAPCFDAVWPRIEPVYRRSAAEGRLSPVNRAFIEVICELLEIDTAIRWSMDIPIAVDQPSPTDRLIALLQASGAGRYVSGPAARDYLEQERLAAAGIELEYMDYSGYPEYPQLHGAFDHHVTALDLLFSCGDQARRCLQR
jgi:hypothetical protein